MKIIEYKYENARPERKELFDNLKYWSNSCGELHHHGEYDIDEADLPDELKSAYHKLWTDGISSLCYLTEYKGKYGIALVNEFHETYAADINSTMEALYSHMQSVANEFYKLIEFTESVILLGEYTGCGDCHEFITVLPWNIDKSIFDNVAKVLLESVYK